MLCVCWCYHMVFLFSLLVWWLHWLLFESWTSLAFLRWNWLVMMYYLYFFVSLVVYIFQVIGLFHLSHQISDLRFVVFLYYLFVCEISSSVPFFIPDIGVFSPFSWLFWLDFYQLYSSYRRTIKFWWFDFLFPVLDFIEVTSFLKFLFWCFVFCVVSFFWFLKVEV